jgi:hypothetical protein
MSQEERIRFLQGCMFVAGLMTLRHELPEISERLKTIQIGWSIPDDQVIATSDEMTKELAEAEREAMN